MTQHHPIDSTHRALISAVLFFIIGLPVGFFTPWVLEPIASNLYMHNKSGSLWPLLFNACIWGCALASPSVLALFPTYRPFVTWRLLRRSFFAAVVSALLISA